MLRRGTQAQPPNEEHSKRQVRANRILDATLELLQRWGYKKTTIDDIAKQAGVAKGTVYLHWKTREALFEALTLREWLSMMGDFQQRLRNDPAGATLSGISRSIISIAVTNPLLKAALQRDSDMLGNLTHSDMGREILDLRLNLLRTHLELLRSRGLMRTNFDLQTQIKMTIAIYTGFFVIDQFVPPNYQFAPEELVDTITETLHRTLEPEEQPAPQALAEASHALDQTLEKLISAIAKKYKELN